MRGAVDGMTSAADPKLFEAGSSDRTTAAPAPTSPQGVAGRRSASRISENRSRTVVERCFNLIPLSWMVARRANIFSFPATRLYLYLSAPSASSIIGPSNEQRQQNNNCSLNPISMHLLLLIDRLPVSRQVLGTRPAQCLDVRRPWVPSSLDLNQSATSEEPSPSGCPTSPALTTHCCDHCPLQPPALHT